MRALVIIIALLALLGGLIYVTVGMASFAIGISILSLNLPAQVQSPGMSSTTIGLLSLLVALLAFVNGLIFVVFGLGALACKRWARILGIFGYSLNIVVCLLTLLTTTTKDSLTPPIVGSFVAISFIIILIFSKKAFEAPLK